MLHDESKVRDKTGDILDAYLELTGFCGELGISDFLLIRKEAIDELKTQNLSARSVKYLPAKRAETVNTAAGRSQARAPERKEPEDKKPVQVPAKPSFHVIEGSAVKTPEPQPEAEETSDQAPEPDDYEILRQMEDPWN